MKPENERRAPAAGPRTEVAVVGGGPAGAVVAAQLASAGHDVTVFERAPAYRWRASGVFSWTAMRQLREIGLDREQVAAVAHSVHHLRLVAADGSTVALAAEDAAGLDRSALDPLLLARAAEAGATVCRGTAVTAIEVSSAGAELSVRDSAGASRVLADVVVGADGIRSLVAANADVLGRPRIARRAGLTYHVAASDGDTCASGDETVLAVFQGGYCGIAPVPRGRLNVGIVLDAVPWAPRLRRDGAIATTRAIVSGIVDRDQQMRELVRSLEPLDGVEGATPLAHGVTSVAGDRWILVGDAAGFLDPFTGEGLGRAFSTALLGADAVHHAVRGDRSALPRYGEACRRRYRDRDRFTLLLLAFLGRPALFSYAVRRAAARPSVRGRLEDVLTEAIPASRAFDPRFLAALLRP